MNNYKWLTLALLSTLALIILGCSGGGGGNSTPPSTFTVSGIASKGPIDTGTVTVFALNDIGSKGNTLGTGTSSSDGSFSINIGTYTGNLIVEVSGGTYVDEASNTSVPNTTLLRVALTSVTGNVNSQVTALTEVATQLAEAAGGLITANIDVANTTVSNNVGGFDILTTVPANTLDASATTASINSQTYGLVLAAISQLVADGTAADVNTVIGNIVSDLSDGTLDTVDTQLVGAITNFVAGGNNQTSTEAIDSTTSSLTNNIPMISGTPPTSVVVGDFYSFTPTVTDADIGDTLVYSIKGKPSWATFNSLTGELSGTPTSLDMGTTSGIVIDVTDGVIATAIALPPFSIAVVAADENISVKVFIDLDGNTDTSVVANDTSLQATVTLVQGSTVLSGTTDANGLVVFSGISGPFTVTGQYDLNSIYGASRIATTLHNISPSAGQVGLPIFGVDVDQAVATPVAGTTISGTISNIPVVPIGYTLLIDVQGAGGTGTFVVTGDGTAPGDQTYTVGVQNDLGAGDYIVQAQVMRFTNINYSREILSGAIHRGLVSTTAGVDTANIDIDFSDPSMAIGFQEKTPTINNYTPVGQNVFTDTTVDFPDLGRVIFQNYEGPDSTMPTTLFLVNSLPTGATGQYSLRVSSDVKEIEALVPIDSAATITLDFVDSPTIVTPEPNQVLTTATAAAMPVSWTVPGSTMPNLEFLIIRSDSNTTGIAGIDYMQWFHLMPGDTTNITLPNTELPMFGPGSSYFLALGYRKEALPFDFSAAFSFDIIGNISDDPEALSIEALRFLPTFSTAP